MMFEENDSSPLSAQREYKQGLAIAVSRWYTLEYWAELLLAKSEVPEVSNHWKTNMK